MANKVVMNKKVNKLSNYYKSELSIAGHLAPFFEDNTTLKDDTCIEGGILQAILFALSNRNDDFLNEYKVPIVKNILNLNPFSLHKVKGLIQSGQIVDASYKFIEVFEKKWPFFSYDVLAFYSKTLIALFECFNFADYLGDTDKLEENSSVLDFGYRLVAYSILWVLSKYSIIAYGELNENELTEYKEKKGALITVGKSSSSDSEVENILKIYGLKSDFLSFNCDIDRKEDFVAIYSAFFKHWEYELLKGDGNLRNKMSVLDDITLKKDWSFFFRLLQKDYFKKPKTAIKISSLIYNFELKDKNDISSIVEEHKVLYNRFTALTLSRYQELKDWIVKDIFQLYCDEYLKEKFEISDKEKMDLSLESKGLKADKRNLTKQITKLNEQNESLIKELELQKGTQKVEISEEQLRELEELKEKIESLMQQNNDLTEDIRKWQNLCERANTKCTELEVELDRLEGVDNSMMVLQNDNNVLLADIEKIELLENEETDLDFEMKYEKIKNEPILFIGGVGDMLYKFTEMFPNSENVNLSENSASFNVPPRFKYVAIYTRVVKHSFCARAESFVSRDNIIYLNILNKKLVVDELYRNIIKDR